MDKARETLYKLHNFSLSKKEKEALLKSAAIDWDAIVSCAREAGLANTLYHEIKTLDNEAPEDKLNILRQSYLFTLSKNLIKLPEILAICGKMNKSGIAYVIIQGWALIFSLYNNMGLRDSVDVDIYVSSKDLKRSIALLAELGYSAGPQAARQKNHMNFSKPPHPSGCGGKKEGTMLIELTDDPFKLTAPIKNRGRFARESAIREMEDVKIRVPSYEYTILSLVVHFQREKISSLQAIYEIACLAHRKKEVLDWKKFLNISREEKLDIPAYFSLRIASNLFRPAIPEFVFDGLDSGRSRKDLFLKLRPGYAEWLNGGQPKSADSSTVFLYDWLTRNTLRQKIRFALAETCKYRGSASIPRLNEPIFKKFTKYISAWISLFSDGL